MSRTDEIEQIDQMDEMKPVARTEARRTKNVELLSDRHEIIYRLWQALFQRHIRLPVEVLPGL